MLVRFEALQYAEFTQQGRYRWRQRLSNLERFAVSPLDQQHAAARARERNRCGRPGRAPADDTYLELPVSRHS
jgi:hypothetical protein